MNMSKELLKLIEKDKKRKISSKEREQQMKSFAYGNTKIDNDRITRELIEDVFNNMEWDSSIISDRIE